MKTSKLLTNVVVSHENQSVGESCEFCDVKHIVVRENSPFNFQSSNQLSETRGFIQVLPENIDTKFVSFVSYRIADKTQGNLNLHSGCKLIHLMKTDEVIAPYTLKNSVARMKNPCQEAPEYATYAAQIYETLIGLSPIIELLIGKTGLDAECIFPFCNSFIMSKESYEEFHQELTKTISRAWVETKFEATWCKYFSTLLPQREFGSLFERFTALWIGLNPKLTIYSNGWGGKYPEYGFVDSLGQLDWNSQNGLIPLAKLPHAQYN